MTPIEKPCLSLIGKCEMVKKREIESLREREREREREIDGESKILIIDFWRRKFGNPHRPRQVSVTPFLISKMNLHFS